MKKFEKNNFPGNAEAEETENDQFEDALCRLFADENYFKLIDQLDKSIAESFSHINLEVSDSNRGTVPQTETVASAVPSADGAASGQQSLSNQPAAASLSLHETPLYEKWTAEQVQNWLTNNRLQFLLSSY